jgi:hypothetical protein
MKPRAPFLCLLLGLFLSGPLPAQTAAPPASTSASPVSTSANPAYVSQARKTIDAVLAEPEFDRTRTIKVPKLKDANKEKSALARLIEWLIKHLSGDTPSNDSQGIGGRFFARFGQFFLWLLAFGLVALLVIHSKRWLPYFGWRRAPPAPTSTAHQADSLLETDVALPEDIATAAERHWKENKKEEALSLLYRGTIELLTAHHCIDLPQGATEEEIRLLVACAMPSFKDDFGNIARAWLRLAYAHRPPADIIDLLAGFNRLQQAGGMAS